MTTDPFQSERFLQDVAILNAPSNGYKFDNRTDTRQHERFVGLVNQGGTCYLNSLLQALFVCKPFLEAVFAWEATGSEWDDVAAALQQLFVKMIYTTAGALDTKLLTDSFGWSGADVVQQHDVHEAWTVLLTSLKSTNEALSKALDASFAGELKDTLTCRACGYTSSRIDTCSDLELAIPKCDVTPVPLSMCLENFFASEELTGDNSVFCDTCKMKTSFTKALTCVRLPPYLLLHLKRFQYEWVSGRVVKINDRVAIPFVLPASTVSGSVADSSVYQLQAVLMHTGTGNSGHYFAYIKDTSPSDAPSTWLMFNDACIEEVTEAQVRATLEQLPTDEIADGAADTSRQKAGKVHRGTPYLLLYSNSTHNALSSTHTATSTLGGPLAPVLERIQAENALREAARQVYAARQRVIQIQVYHPARLSPGKITGVADLSSTPISFWAPATSCMADVTNHLLQNLPLTTDVQPTVSLLRIRRYDPAARSMLDVYSGSVEFETLQKLNLTGSVTLAVEFRGSDDIAWPMYDPRAINLQVYRWGSDVDAYFECIRQVKAAALAGLPCSDVTFPSMPHAVMDLHIPGAVVDVFSVDDVSIAVAASALGIPTLLQRGVLVSGGLPPLSDAALSIRAPISLFTRAGTDRLVKDVGCANGDALIIALEGIDPPTFFEAIKNACMSDSITLLINPVALYGSVGHETDEKKGDLECIPLSASKLETLASVKAKAAAAVNHADTCRAAPLDPLQLHLSRGVKAPMFRDETLRLVDVDIGDFAELHLSSGAPLHPHEVLISPLIVVPLEAEVGGSRSYAQCRLPAVRVSVDVSVSKFRRTLYTLAKAFLEHHRSHITGDPATFDVRNLRLRVKTSITYPPLPALPERTSSVSLGAWSFPLKTDISVRSALQPLIKAANATSVESQSGTLILDHAEMLVEFLPTPSEDAADHMLVRFREFKQTTTGPQLLMITELSVSRRCTISEVMHSLKVEDVSVVRVVKPATSTGLTAASADRLKWVSLRLDDTTPLSESVLALKEGVTVLWRRDAVAEGGDAGGPDKSSNASKPWLVRTTARKTAAPDDAVCVPTRRELGFKILK